MKVQNIGGKKETFFLCLRCLNLVKDVNLALFAVDHCMPKPDVVATLGSEPSRITNVDSRQR